MITQFIYQSLHHPKIDGKTSNGQCCMCGSGNGELLCKDFLKSSFTNWDSLKLPGSQCICQACACCLSANQLRKSSWIATGTEMIYLKRGDISIAIFDNLSIPNAIYITTSYKKHGSFKTRINHRKDKIYIQFEETGVWLIREDAKKILKQIEILYSIPDCEVKKKQPKSFFTKDEILYGNYSMHRVRAFGTAELMDVETFLSEFRDSPQYALLIYIANKRALGRSKKV